MDCSISITRFLSLHREIRNAVLGRVMGVLATGSTVCTEARGDHRRLEGRAKYLIARYIEGVTIQI